MKPLNTLALALALVSSGAFAVPPAPTEKTDVLKLKGDAKAGEEAYEVCSACHLADGMGRPDGSLPVVSGQHAKVLVKQITDIRAGLREAPTMHPFALSMTPQDIVDTAAYMSSLKPTAENGKGPGNNLKGGEELYKKDCQSCHGAKGEGNEEKVIPVLAGEHFKYMQRQIGEMREGKRKNADKDMLKVVKPYSDADIEAVSDYLSRLTVAARGKKGK
jgi:cytochrome c553